MSAWLCSQDHINLIVNASPDPSQETFNMLVQENLNSLRDRYEGCAILKDWEVAALGYIFEKIEPKALVERVYAQTCKDDPHISNCYPATKKRITAKLVSAQIAHSCASYDYQSCEHEGWQTSEAKKLVDAVEAKHRTGDDADNGCLWSF